MRLCTTFLLIILTACQVDYKSSPSQKKVDDPKEAISAETQALGIEEFEQLKLNGCDTFSCEVHNIYPEQKEILAGNLDTAYLDNFLKEQGFEVVNSGWGNYQKGPRILSLELAKDDCKCKVFKMYETVGDGFVVKEKIVCNALNSAFD